jgi:hypothetical protein
MELSKQRLNELAEQRRLELLQNLNDCPKRKFSEWLKSDIESVRTGVYCIWNENDELVYVGMSGREYSKKIGSTKPYGLRLRLHKHASGKLSGDQFCVYVANRIIIPQLLSENLSEYSSKFSDGTLTLNLKVKEHIHKHFSYNFTYTENEQESYLLEDYIRKKGINNKKSFLNSK